MTVAGGGFNWLRPLDFDGTSNSSMQNAFFVFIGMNGGLGG
jgi:hypothetical protein